MRCRDSLFNDAHHDPSISKREFYLIGIGIKGAAVVVQFGKYAFVAHDLFVSFYVSDIFDAGIELRQGRGVPAVPLVLISVAP